MTDVVPFDETAAAAEGGPAIAVQLHRVFDLEHPVGACPPQHEAPALFSQQPPRPPAPAIDVEVSVVKEALDNDPLDEPFLDDPRLLVTAAVANGPVLADAPSCRFATPTIPVVDRNAPIGVRATTTGFYYVKVEVFEHDPATALHTEAQAKRSSSRVNRAVAAARRAQRKGRIAARRTFGSVRLLLNTQEADAPRRHVLHLDDPRDAVGTIDVTVEPIGCGTVRLVEEPQTFRAALRAVVDHELGDALTDHGLLVARAVLLKALDKAGVIAANELVPRHRMVDDVVDVTKGYDTCPTDKKPAAPLPGVMLPLPLCFDVAQALLFELGSEVGTDERLGQRLLEAIAAVVPLPRVREPDRPTSRSTARTLSRPATAATLAPGTRPPTADAGAVAVAGALDTTLLLGRKRALLAKHFAERARRRAEGVAVDSDTTDTDPGDAPRVTEHSAAAAARVAAVRAGERVRVRYFADLGRLEPLLTVHQLCAALCRPELNLFGRGGAVPVRYHRAAEGHVVVNAALGAGATWDAMPPERTVEPAPDRAIDTVPRVGTFAGYRRTDGPAQPHTQRPTLVELQGWAPPTEAPDLSALFQAEERRRLWEERRAGRLQRHRARLEDYDGRRSEAELLGVEWAEQPPALSDSDDPDAAPTEHVRVRTRATCAEYHRKRLEYMELAECKLTDCYVVNCVVRGGMVTGGIVECCWVANRATLVGVEKLRNTGLSRAAVTRCFPANCWLRHCTVTDCLVADAHAQGLDSAAGTPGGEEPMAPVPDVDEDTSAGESPPAEVNTPAPEPSPPPQASDEGGVLSDPEARAPEEDAQPLNDSADHSHSAPQEEAQEALEEREDGREEEGSEDSEDMAELEAALAWAPAPAPANEADAVEAGAHTTEAAEASPTGDKASEEEEGTSEARAEPPRGDGAVEELESAQPALGDAAPGAKEEPREEAPLEEAPPPAAVSTSVTLPTFVPESDTPSAAARGDVGVTSAMLEVSMRIARAAHRGAQDRAATMYSGVCRCTMEDCRLDHCTLVQCRVVGGTAARCRDDDGNLLTDVRILR